MALRQLTPTRFYRPQRAAAAAVAAGIATLALSLAASGTAHAQDKARDAFALKNGDRVVFYGDSITDQRMYTLLTEQYIVTRFPERDIRFVHSGWGGDRVSGGAGGPIDVRLDRDVTAYKPTVVTIMLGMNDGAYKPFDESVFQAYAKGYQHIVDKLKKDNPGVRLTLIQPSPFDDVTRAPTVEGGYNTVLQRYGLYLNGLASTANATLADMNKPVVDVLTKAKATDAANAEKIIPDRVHPGWGGHLIMAQALLKAWNAPSLVSAVTIDATARKATTAENAEVKNIKTAADGSLTWTATEGSLPFPIQPPDPGSAEPYNLALASSDFIESLNRQMLTVTNLAAPSYTLKIDDQEVGTFTKEQLAAGVNLAPLDTPMLKQAQLVAQLTRLRANLHNARWREVQVPRAGDKAVQPLLPALLKDIDMAGEDLTRAQRAAAKPRPHTFTLVPKG